MPTELPTSRPRALLLAFLALAVTSSTLLHAADTPVIAFGDSITEGYGDDPDSPHPGYPGRLESLLRNAGYPTSIANWGVGGETTAEGLSRVDEALADGGEVFLLMEGTNDINRQISGETIRFNLNAMATKAEALGMRVVHASVIPHRPDGTGDIENLATRDVQEEILGLAETQGRAVVDAFSLFWDEPDYAGRFFIDLPPEEDPVGHPNPDGYDLLAGAFFDVVRDVLASGTGSGEISVLSNPVVAGQLASFAVDLRGAFRSVQWRFGTSGWADARPEEGFAADFVFDRPGTFTVSVRAVDAAGRVISDELQVNVQGSTPTWRSSLALVPLARRTHPAPATARSWTELRIDNLSAVAVRAEIELLAPTLLPRDIGERAATTPIAIGLRPGQSALLADVLNAIGIGEGDGAIRLRYLAASGSAAPHCEASARILREDAAGQRSEPVRAVPESEWVAGDRFVGGLDAAFGATGALVIANPDTQNATVGLQLFGPNGLSLGDTSVSVPPATTLVRSLGALFPTISSASGPFGLRANSVARRVVVGLESAADGGSDRAYLPMRVESGLATTMFLPTLGDRGDGLTRRVVLFNPGVTDVVVQFALLRLGAANTSPPTASRTVAAGNSLVIDDPRTTLFSQSDDGTATIRLVWSSTTGVAPVALGLAASTAGAATSLSSTVRASATEGTFSDEALLPLPAPGSPWVPRVGFMELESSALLLRIELLDQRRELLAARNLQLLRRELDEMPLEDLFPGLAGSAWAVRVSLPDGGAALAYVTSRSPSGDLDVRTAIDPAAP